MTVAENRKKSGDLVGALSVYLNLEEEGSKNGEIFARIAALYFDMEIYERSMEYWFRYLATSDSAKVKTRAFSALAACACMMGDSRTMAMYAELEFALNPTEEQEYDKVLLDYYDYVYENMGGGYYVSYPEKYIPAKRLMFEADSLIADGEDLAAIERLEKVQKDSEYYTEARMRIARSLLALGRAEEAEEMLEELIEEFPDDPFANMAYGFIRLDKHDEERAIKHLKNAAIGELFDEEDYLKIAFALCRLGCDKDAFLPVERSLEINEYYLNGIYLYGLINYNNGEYETAKEYFKRFYSLTRNTVARYLIGLCDTRDPETLDYTFSSPTDKSLEQAKKITVLVATGKKSLAGMTDEEIEELIDWSLNFNENLQQMFLDFLLENASVRIKNYIIKKLIGMEMAGEIKLLVIEKLVMLDYNKKISFSIESNFIKVHLVPADFDEGKNKVFKRAFAFASARVSPFAFDLRKLRDNAYRIFDRLVDNGNLKKVSDVNALGCLIAINCGFQIKNKQLYDLFFKTTEGAVSEILDLLNE